MNGQPIEQPTLNRDYVPETTFRGRQLSRLIQQLYDTGVRMYSKEMLREIEDSLERGVPGSLIPIRCLNGDFFVIEVPPPNDTMQVFLQLTTLQELRFKASVAFNNAPEHEANANMTEDDVQIFSCPVLMRYGDRRGPGLPIDDLIPIFERARTFWQTSDFCSDLIDTLQSAPYFPIANKIVCLGLGSLGEAYGDEDDAECDGNPRNRCETQHAAALSMARVLGERFGTAPLRVLCADIDYTQEDVAVLEMAGIEVIRGFGGLGFTHIDDETVVFCCQPNFPIKQIVAEIATPAAMVWPKTLPRDPENERLLTYVYPNGRMVHTVPYTAKMESVRTRRLIEEYTDFPLPPEYDRFADLSVFVRNW